MLWRDVVMPKPRIGRPPGSTKWMDLDGNPELVLPHTIQITKTAYNFIMEHKELIELAARGLADV